MTSRSRSKSAGDKPSTDSLDAIASDWLIAHDRGLTEQEQHEFEDWLAADPRHVKAWAEAQAAWARLDRLPELTPATMSPRASARVRGWLTMTAAAAAVLVLGFSVWPLLRPPSEPGAAEIVRITPRQFALSDGSRVELNSGGEVAEQFTANERRVRLVRGEAHFTVVQDTVRDFVVEAGGVAVRAVGTAFNVRLESEAVEVLVTHGQVRVDPPVRRDAASSRVFVPVESPLLGAGQRAIVGLAPDALPPQVTTISEDDMARELAWQALQLQFHDAPLDKVAAAFNRHNPTTRLVVDRSAAEVLVAGTFHAENLEVFVHFLEQGFGISAERRRDGSIILRLAP
jgi:transmembrane sensor